MNTALLIAQLLNTATPGIVEIVLLIKKQDGTIAIVPLLDQADSKFTANMQQAAKWLEEHK
jgi:hypothetical protein